jgi:quercetin dioxygenase-like cupin family protein
MTQQAGAADTQVGVLRAADRATQDGFFATAIAGNRVATFGVVELGSGWLKMALAETDAGATFPFQYHTGGMELAVAVAGAGAIEVGEDEAERSVYEFSSGDVVLIPPGIVYRVCNRSTDQPLVAWIFFAEETTSYWPGGERAQETGAAT